MNKLIPPVIFSLVVILGSIIVLYGNSHLFQKKPSNPAKNIILFIGDGMGAEQRKAARWAKVGQGGQLSMDNMPVSGMLKTRSANKLKTDSAAGATAMATGVRTNNGFLSLDTNYEVLPTILESALKQGKRVGLVTTTHVTHATPAAFYSHVLDRYLMNLISEKVVDSHIDVLLGGGEDGFLPLSETGCFEELGERGDGRNLINEMVAAGYTYVCNETDLDNVKPTPQTKLLGLFGDEGMVRPFSPSLVSMTKKAIEILSQGPNGFFLMVEGGQIDWAGHRNDAEHIISDIIDLDEAVDIAKEYSALSKDTLVIVTADHETGGMSVSSTSSGLPSEDGPFTTADGKKFYVNWSVTGHTAVDVPVTAQGKFSHKLTGINDNTIIYDVMMSAMGQQ